MTAVYYESESVSAPAMPRTTANVSYVHDEDDSNSRLYAEGSGTGGVATGAEASKKRKIASTFQIVNEASTNLIGICIGMDRV